ncbi:hypothetical protein PtA15_12A260 [Puccinia triticina]|uniref:Coatomer alpha subunit C-terminal domain-containing protein n=1 Tax=Puccinia triticina TaxID=208348 RepID=A0ABY7D1X7_9BASI|nr:uncharacterized protein PtA15_12A260 [Puccinia triticina]WAQ90272.1 hypothetical protein PtA15_12A260 [Puccinia triticina]
MFIHHKSGTSTVEPITTGRRPRPQPAESPVLLIPKLGAVPCGRLAANPQAASPQAVKMSVGKPGSGPSSKPNTFEEHCPNCGSALDSSTAIKVGQMFYLGTKYLDVLSLRVGGNEGQAKRAVKMGFFEIGIR